MQPEQAEDRQRRARLCLGLAVLFFVLTLLLATPDPSEDANNSKKDNEEGSSNPFDGDSEEGSVSSDQPTAWLRRQMRQASLGLTYPSNLTGNYKGRWSMAPMGTTLLPRSNLSTVVSFLGNPPKAKLGFEAFEGVASLGILAQPTRIPGLHHLWGGIRFLDGNDPTQLRSLTSNVMQGLYLEATGELILVVSPQGYVVGLSSSEPPPPTDKPSSRRLSRREGSQRLLEDTTGTTDGDQGGGGEGGGGAVPTPSPSPSPDDSIATLSGGSDKLNRCALEMRLHTYPVDSVQPRALRAEPAALTRPSSSDGRPDGVSPSAGNKNPPADPWMDDPDDPADDGLNLGGQSESGSSASPPASAAAGRRAMSRAFSRRLMSAGDPWETQDEEEEEEEREEEGVNWRSQLRRWLRERLHGPDAPQSGFLGALGRVLPWADDDPLPGFQMEWGSRPRRARHGSRLLATLGRARGFSAAIAGRQEMSSTLSWFDKAEQREEPASLHRRHKRGVRSQLLPVGRRLMASVDDDPAGDVLLPLEGELGEVARGAYFAVDTEDPHVRSLRQQQEREAQETLQRAGDMGRFFAPGRRGSMQGPELLPMYGVLTSPNCNFTMNVSLAALVVDRDTVDLRATIYTMTMILCVVAQSVVVLSLLTRAVQLPAVATRLSLLSLGMQTLLDAYLTLFHLIGAVLWESTFWAFTILSLLQLFLFSILEMRLILISWKARRPDAFAAGWDVVRRELGVLYARFYGALLLGMVAIYYFADHMPVLLGLIFSFWVPQIVHSAQHDQRPPFTLLHLGWNSALRLIPILYFYGCPYNFLTQLGARMENQPFAFGMVAWLAVQIGILIAQQRFGPRFFIPDILLPRKYDYHRPVRIDRHGRVLPDADGSDASSSDEQPPPPAPAGAEGREGGGEGGAGEEGRAGAAERPQRTRLGEMWRTVTRLYRRVQRRRARRQLEQEWVRSVQRRRQPRRPPSAPGPYLRLPEEDATRGATAPALPEEGSGGSEEGGREGTREEDLELGHGHPGARHATDESSPPPPPAAGAGAPMPEGPDGEGEKDRKKASPTGEEAEGGGEDEWRDPHCAICLCDLELPAAPTDYMVTPCNHIFHKDCLVEWMRHKMECPVCRAALPEP